MKLLNIKFEEQYTLFFIRTSNFAAEAEPFLFFSRFEPKMF